eukprot:434801_1
MHDYSMHIIIIRTIIALYFILNLCNCISDYSFYFEEYRFDWNNLNDWDENDCTNQQILHKSHTKLCIKTSPSSSKSTQFTFSSHNRYYNNIDLNFDNNNDWNSISSIDGINGYEAISKCQSLKLIELCAIYNPYSDNYQINTKILKKRHKKSISSYITHDQSSNTLSSAHIDIQQLLTQSSIADFTNLALQYYDDNIQYNNQRIKQLQQKRNNNDKKQNDKEFGSHTYLFDELQLDWDNNNDWNWDINNHKYNTRCTQIIPFIHSHICMHITNNNDAKIYFKKSTDNEINKLYASAYITYNGDDLNDLNEDEEEEIASIIINNFEDELFTLSSDTSMDEWYDNIDGSEWIVSSESISSNYDYQ